MHSCWGRGTVCIPVREGVQHVYIPEEDYIAVHKGGLAGRQTATLPSVSWYSRYSIYCTYTTGII